MAYTVLLVEDEVDLAEICQEVFEAEGFAVDVVSNGQDAVDKIKASQSPYDLIFCDAYMPIINGLELLRIISEEALPMNLFYLVTGDSSIPLDRVLDLGGTGIINKPYELDSIIDQVKKLLE